MSEINEILEVKREAVDNSIVVHNKKNLVGTILKLIGRIIMGIGMLGGLIIGSLLTTPAPPLNWVYGFAIILSSFISGILLIGFGEIIILLNDIKYNTNKM